MPLGWRFVTPECHDFPKISRKQISQFTSVQVQPGISIKDVFYSRLVILFLHLDRVRSNYCAKSWWSHCLLNSVLQEKINNDLFTQSWHRFIPKWGVVFGLGPLKGMGSGLNTKKRRPLTYHTPWNLACLKSQHLALEDVNVAIKYVYFLYRF